MQKEFARAYKIRGSWGLLTFLKSKAMGFSDEMLADMLLNKDSFLSAARHLDEEAVAAAAADGAPGANAASGAPVADHFFGGSLFVKVVRGIDLSAKDKSGTSDPFVVMQCDQQKHRSKPVMRSLAPVWPDAEHEFRVDSQFDSILDVQIWVKKDLNLFFLFIYFYFFFIFFFIILFLQRIMI